MSSEAKGLRRVLDLVAPHVRRALEVGSLTPSAFATPLAVASYALDKTGIVVVTATSTDAAQLREGVQSLLGDDVDVAMWPAWDTHPLERVSPDIAVMAERAQLRWRLSQGVRPTVIVAPVRALAQMVAPHPPVTPLIMERGAAVDRDEFTSALVSYGYRRESLVEHRAEFAVRGGIVDLWPADAEIPIRLDFFGDEVERLTQFDIATQRSIGDLESVAIAPAREWIPTASQRARAETWSRTRSWGRDVADRIAQGQLFDSMEGWMTLYADERRGLLDEIDGFEVVVVEPTRVRSRLEDLLHEERELTEVVSQTWSADIEIPLMHLDEAQSLRHVDLTLDASASATGLMSSPPVVQGDPSRIAAHARTWSPGRRAVVLTSNVAAVTRMVEQLRGEGLDVTADPERALDVRVSVLVSTLPSGFWLEDPEIVVWSEADLTGRRAVHRVARSRSRSVEGFFDDLAVGSYVVHRQHGVARFSGTTTRAINGTTRDYLILEFKDGRSYWPTEQIDALTPYAGGESPTLSRMGGVEWQKSRAKARAEAFVIAQELVDLYRQRSVVTGHAFRADTTWQLEMEDLFAHPLTPDQIEAMAAIKADMESPRPMDRLVVADVGFGKTELAVRAVFKAVQDNKQAAILVPTTLLASQHLATFSERFAGYPVRVALLSRFVEDVDARATIAGLKDGSVDVVIGTHRLLGEGITFKDLGLLVVDEEQRFGVGHKEAIKARSIGVDVLTLSASPIPRTMEMAFAGIRDLSMVTTPPVDRRPILTHVGEYDERAIVEAIRRELLREGQVFFVHNRVSDIDEVARRLTHLVPDARIAIAHGQMDEGTLERVMIDFWERRFDVLVCTTIVENGIDLPSVNTLIVDRAERLGLGQLHQLRGRVGRGGQRAYAYLFHADSKVLSETAYERLRTIGDNTALGSGFKIAMRDLEIRGSGSFLGHEQSGTSMAAVGFDLYIQLVAEAVADARGIVAPEVSTVTLDIPGDAHLPSTYVEADDARLEAYLRLAAVQDEASLNDLEVEWIDRYGALPAPAKGLLELARLRLTCLAHEISSITLAPARIGIRSTPLVRVSPVVLSLSQQMRLRRTHGSRAYDEAAKEIRWESAKITSAVAIRQALVELFDASPLT